MYVVTGINQIERLSITEAIIMFKLLKKNNKECYLFTLNHELVDEHQPI
jgi:hypothetical protein